MFKRHYAILSTFCLIMQLEIVEPLRAKVDQDRVSVHRKTLYNPYHPEDGELTDHMSRFEAPEEESDGHFRLRGTFSDFSATKRNKDLKVNGRTYKFVTNRSEFYYSSDE